MTITEALPQTATRTRDAATAGPDGTTGDAATGACGSEMYDGAAMYDAAAKASPSLKDGDAAGFRPVPVWFFVFEGLMGAAYDIVKSYPNGWMFLAACAAVNIVLARTVLRGRLKMAKAMLKGKRTRMIAIGLIALRMGLHVAFGAIGIHATSGPAHVALAAAMCAATVALLAFDQKVMLRALSAA